MKFFIEIVITLAATIALGLSYVLFNFVRFKYFSSKYSDYDREFSTEEQNFFKQSSTAITVLYNSPPKFPRWYSWYLYTAFVPTMLLTWLIAFIAWVGLAWMAKVELEARYPDALVLQTTELGISALFILFACIFIAGWLLYFISGFSKRLALFVVMNSDAHGFDKSSVKEGHVFRLEHNIRTSKLSVDEVFEPKVFVRNKIKLYKRFLGWCSLIILLAGLVFAIFDLRQFTVVTPEGLFKRSNYYSKKIERLEYNEVEIVKFRCHTHDDGVQHTSYDLFLNKDSVIEIENIEQKLDSIYLLDKKLRRALVEVRPYIYSPDDGEEIYRLEKTCLDAIGDPSNIDRVKSIFHVDQYLGKTP